MIEQGTAVTAPVCTSSSSVPCQHYTYDQWGNRIVPVSKSVPTSVFEPTLASDVSAATNRLTLNGSTYDSAGNLKTIGGFSWDYNAENLLTGSSFTVSGSTSSQSFTYDAEGHRVKKGNTVFVYDAFGHLAAEYGGATVATGTQYFAADHLGSTRAVIDGATLTVSKRMDYLPFGATLPAGYGGRPAGTYESAEDATNPRQRFTGKERDAETGLDYFGARYMSSAQGRFTSPDPKQFTKRHLESPQKWNKYAYVQNNPLASIDPDGLDDYKVFITANVAVHPDWGRAKQVVESQGHMLQVFVGGEATLKRFTDARSDANARVVFVGHTIGPGHETPRTGVSLGDNGVLVGNTAQQQPLGGIPGAPWDAGPAKANTVALFGCQSIDLASGYSGTNFIGMDSGADHVTDLVTLGNAAFSFVVADALARPADGTPRSGFIGPLEDPVASANAAVAASRLKRDEGDRVVSVPQEVKRQ